MVKVCHDIEPGRTSMAIIRTGEEQKHLAERVKGTTHYSTWLSGGQYHVEEGTIPKNFMWLRKMIGRSGRPSYFVEPLTVTYYRDGYPKGGKGDARWNCLSMYPSADSENGKWYNTECTHLLPAICELRCSGKPNL